jgi:hypothetical protein
MDGAAKQAAEGMEGLLLRASKNLFGSLPPFNDRDDASKFRLTFRSTAVRAFPVQKAWKLARSHIMSMPSANDAPSSSATAVSDPGDVDRNG